MEGIEAVIEAMAAARAKQAQIAQNRAQPVASAPPAGQPARPTQPAPVPTPAPAPPQKPPAQQRARAGLLQGVFEDGNSLLKAVVASEVLGPPAALRERHLWNHSPNEPST